MVRKEYEMHNWRFYVFPDCERKIKNPELLGNSVIKFLQGNSKSAQKYSTLIYVA